MKNIIFTVFVLVVMYSQFVIAAASYYGNLDPDRQAAVRKIVRNTDMTLEGAAKILIQQMVAGKKLPAIRPIFRKRKERLSVIKGGVDTTFLAESLGASGMDPRLLIEALADHYEDFETGDDESRKGMAWHIVASYKARGEERVFAELEELKNDLMTRSFEKGIAPHAFGEWFDGLPAGDANVKAIHLLTKVMGLSDTVATEAIRAGLPYDDYETIVDAGAESADPESSIRDALRRHVPGPGETGTGYPAAAAASSGYGGADFAGHAAGTASDISFSSVNPMGKAQGKK